jgi:hypothetical protein
MVQAVIDRLESVVEHVLDSQAEEDHVSTEVEKQLVSVFTELQKEALEEKRIEDAVKFAMRLAKITLELPNLKISDDNLKHFEDMIKRNRERALQFHPGFENFFDNFGRVADDLRRQLAQNVPEEGAEVVLLPRVAGEPLRGINPQIFVNGEAVQDWVGMPQDVQPVAIVPPPVAGEVRNNAVYWPRYGWLPFNIIRHRRSGEQVMDGALIQHLALNNEQFPGGWRLG